ncbi:MAG: serine/threonine-protein kinase [Chloroflexota bacterium]
MPQPTIGPYEIKAELGRGGMATVYLAHDPRFGRDVALKILHPQFLHDPVVRARFEREAQVFGNLEHPAIVPLYDVGEINDRPYLVMRYMPGGSLADRIAVAPLPLQEVASIAQRIGAVLDFAHNQGIIHRDVKPSNILFDRFGKAFLSDFSIARPAASSGTLTGVTGIGTPDYMSPGQARGDLAIDGRSDLYALGVVLYTMLAGRTPYRADTPMGVAVQHVTAPVPHILEVKSDLPARTQAIISRSLAKNPADCYPSGAAMAAAVTELAHERTAARRTQGRPRGHRLLTSLRRSPLWLLLVAALAITLFLSGLGFVAGRAWPEKAMIATATQPATPLAQLPATPALATQVAMTAAVHTLIETALAQTVAAYSPTPTPTIIPTATPRPPRLEGEIGAWFNSAGQRFPLRLNGDVEASDEATYIQVNHQTDAGGDDGRLYLRPGTRVRLERAAEDGFSILLSDCQLSGPGSRGGELPGGTMLLPG